MELPDGLRYQILSPGTGNPPKPTDTVKVNYTGALIDGSVFDSSERQGKPGEFVLNKRDRRLDRGTAEDRQGRKDAPLRSAAARLRRRRQAGHPPGLRPCVRGRAPGHPADRRRGSPACGKVRAARATRGAPPPES